MNRYLCGWHFAEHLAYGCASGGGAVPQRRPGENYRKMHGDESGFQIPKRFRTSHRFGARGSFRPEDKASRIYKIIAAACFVPLFLLGFIIFDSIYYPTVETEDFSMSDSACLVCTKEGNIYILYRNNANASNCRFWTFTEKKPERRPKCRQRKMAPLKWAASSIISRR